VEVFDEVGVATAFADRTRLVSFLRWSATVARVNARLDPYAVLEVPRDADQAAIHAAYRKAVTRTHPDVGGSAVAFEAVQDAYETLRDPAQRRALDAEPPRATPPRPRAAPSPRNPEFSGKSMEDLLAESRRLEDEARRLAGLPPRPAEAASPDGDVGDSLGAILRDAGQQLRTAAEAGARELRRRARRPL
jgi:curved DNA-binding protein CbpA